MKKYPNSIVFTKKWIKELFCILFSLIYIIPLWMVLINSFKTRVEANEYGLGLPKVFYPQSYITVFTEGNILRAFFNGTFVAVIVIIISIIITSMAGFSIARQSSRLSNYLYLIFCAGIIVPIAVIPTFVILQNLHLINTYTALILVFTAYTIPLGIFMYVGFIKTIPRQLDESAIVDGCGRIKLFFYIIFPLLRPITTTLVIFNFFGVWNDVLTPLYFVSSSKWSMPLTIYKFYGKYLSDWNLVFADVIICLIPLFIVYIFAQKYIISGLTAGAVKG